MDDEKQGPQITLEAVRPGPLSRRWMSRLPSTPFYSPEQAINDAQDGRGRLYGVRVDGKPSAVMLLGLAGRNLDVIALAGDLGSVKGLPALVDVLGELARENGLSGVSCRTARLGLGRRLVDLGWQSVETIYRIEV